MDDSIPPYLPTDAPRLDVDTPEWFDWAVARPVESRFADDGSCRIHYLYWPEDPGPADAPPAPGVLLLHGGGAHANWWRFIAPYLTRGFRVAAMDLSGMGDSDSRPEYNATIRAREIQAVFEDAGFLDGTRAKPFIVGHSFGGLTAMRYAALYPERLSGFVIADSPIRPPEIERKDFDSRPPDPVERRQYDSFNDAFVRFRLRPRQSCENDFIVEFIARHSIRKVADGDWTWKFDPEALSRNRHAESFRNYLTEIRCRTAVVYGERSAISTPEVVKYTLELLDAPVPVVGIPNAQHHLILDQPLAFVAAVRVILERWMAERD